MSFWGSEVNLDVNGTGNTDDPNTVGLPTALMQTESTFTDAGWRRRVKAQSKPITF